MGASPEFKVYREISKGYEYIAACKYPEDAARLISHYGDQIRYGHKRVVWQEGAEKIQAWMSFDFVAETVYNRVSNREV